MSDAQQGGAADEPEETPVDMAEFLRKSPPYTPKTITDLQTRVGGHNNLNLPLLRLYCDECEGERIFESSSERPYIGSGKAVDLYAVYTCRNCYKSVKTYSLTVVSDNSTFRGFGLKYGEMPPLGPPTPRQLWALVESERDAFLKGRRCETQGLGIGAFAYYRRVVENQKNRILDEIIKVAEKTGASPEIISNLKAAKKETQFKKAVEMVKDAIPETLKIDGHHNPLTLLHDALSEHLHEHTDEECLAIATSIREVLQDLGERSANALKDRAALTAAVSRLQNRGAPQSPLGNSAPEPSA
jgi:hypothetical protein